MLFVTRRQQVEHEGFALLRAATEGVRVPALLAWVRPTTASRWSATRSVAGPRLAESGGTVTDATLQALWQQVAALHAAGIAHGRLSASAVVARTEGPVIVDFATATTTPDSRHAGADVAELLAATAALVGVERAVATAAPVGGEALAASLPLLQPAALTAAAATPSTGPTRTTSSRRCAPRPRVRRTPRSPTSRSWRA